MAKGTTGRGGDLGPSWRVISGVGSRPPMAPLRSRWAAVGLARGPSLMPILRIRPHSHSMVAGGLLVMSYTTRLTLSFISFVMRTDIVSRTSCGIFE